MRKTRNNPVTFAVTVVIISGTVPNSEAATWYTDTYLEFDEGTFTQTAIRSTSTAAYIELERQGASELFADDKTVGLYHMNDGGPSPLTQEK